MESAAAPVPVLCPDVMAVSALVVESGRISRRGGLKIWPLGLGADSDFGDGDRSKG